MISILQIFRKKNPSFFSIEKVFSVVEPLLTEKFKLNAITLPFYTKGFLEILLNITFVKKHKSAKVYHVTGDVHYVVLGLPANKTVLTIHDCVFLHRHQGLKAQLFKWLFLDMPVRRSKIVTTISEFSRQEIIQHSHCNPDKVIVIPDPVSDVIYFKEKNFNTDKPTILFIGVTPNKNLERVCEALTNISCRLCILGKLNSEQTTLLENKKIEFFSIFNVSELELAKIYTDCDIVLFPSTFEGFGLPILEGQKAGRVVISSNLDPMKSVAGKGALLVDPYDIVAIRNAVQLVVKDEQKRNELISEGFENIKKYDTKMIASAYQKVYERIAFFESTEK